MLASSDSYDGLSENANKKIVYHSSVAHCKVTRAAAIMSSVKKGFEEMICDLYNNDGNNNNKNSTDDDEAGKDTKRDRCCIESSSF